MIPGRCQSDDLLRCCGDNRDQSQDIALSDYTLVGDTRRTCTCRQVGPSHSLKDDSFRINPRVDGQKRNIASTVWAVKTNGNETQYADEYTELRHQLITRVQCLIGPTSTVLKLMIFRKHLKRRVIISQDIQRLFLGTGLNCTHT